MRLIDIPPYRGMNYSPEEGHFLVKEIVDNMKKRGQLDGIELDIDEGYPTEYRGENRSEIILASITAGFLERVREVNEMGKYDAIVTSGSIEPGFHAGREISNIPIAFSVHSGVYMAAILGDRFSIIELTDEMGQIIRRYVDGYGLGHKLMGIRTIGRSSTQMASMIITHKKEVRVLFDGEFIDVPFCS